MNQTRKSKIAQRIERATLAAKRTEAARAKAAADGDNFVTLDSENAEPALAAPEAVAIPQAERDLVSRWIKARLIDWPQGSCLYCKKPVVIGQEFVDVAGADGSSRARFHRPCLDQRESEARQALGLEEAPL